MHFDGAKFHLEMMRLVRASREAFLAEPVAAPLYSVSIWTDPDAARSAVSFDTREKSEAVVARLAAWAQEQQGGVIAASEPEIAALMLRVPDRNRNPADFAFVDLVEIKHQSVESGWNERSRGECWKELGPALERVGEEACGLFADLVLEDGALLGVNTKDDWFGRTWALRAPVA